MFHILINCTHFQFSVFLLNIFSLPLNFGGGGLGRDQQGFVLEHSHVSILITELCNVIKRSKYLLFAAEVKSSMP